ncbi:MULTISPECIES: enoyl-CoA hydratase/isomerase family protein [unclassified Streptomyces]|uniref:enoyl-CoA hydratase/isomerase family protein n=1 Tax=unclassified Streptomyces TaxID=2593676 RepID=UPI0022578463|nr:MULTISPECIES: enoyl-CoA hydratase/isomerase family protein [unclassified Streptomyces]MCX5337254.1 enoyl-CoA hydratase/isomerase family protein [Streptomyces sp. NBC_00140]MCX5365795.1 enoyl-CoA hydratase/isomerase family protein [Streptomyces sp. NBC_00124]
MSLPTSAEPVRIVRHPDGVVELRLDDPGRGNALDLRTSEALRDTTAEVAADPGGAVLLRAAGGSFCVGGDLRAFAGRGAETGAYVHAVATAAHAAIQALHDLPVPLVTAVRGAAAGGGIGLALVGDIVLAARSARFRLAYTAIGLTPDCGASWFLPRLAGPRLAADLILTNRVLTGDDAERLGLVSRSVDDGQLDDAARRTAAGLAAGAGDALRAAKGLLRVGAGEELRRHLAEEARLIALLADGGEAQDRMASFLAARGRSEAGDSGTGAREPESVS